MKKHVNMQHLPSEKVLSNVKNMYFRTFFFFFAIMTICVWLDWSPRQVSFCNTLTRRITYYPVITNCYNCKVQQTDCSLNRFFNFFNIKWRSIHSRSYCERLRDVTLLHFYEKEWMIYNMINWVFIKLFHLVSGGRITQRNDREFNQNLIDFY